MQSCHPRDEAWCVPLSGPLGSKSLSNLHWNEWIQALYTSLEIKALIPKVECYFRHSGAGGSEKLNPDRLQCVHIPHVNPKCMKKTGLGLKKRSFKIFSRLKEMIQINHSFIYFTDVGSEY